jgi:type III pantothenate kinase
MNLALDIGNTLQKIAVFFHDECVFCKSFPVITEKILQSVFHQFSIQNSIVSSVAGLDEQVSGFLTANTQFLHYSHKTKLPITILYQSATTLGLDRIANAAGAAALFPEKNVLSIQAGTCIVLDFVNEKGEYIGGSISPGIQMRLESLHKKTKNLPLLSVVEHHPGILGNNTNSSIYCGVTNGVGYEIDGFIEAYKAQFDNLIVLLTGGDMAYMQKLIKNTIFAAPNLVLKGLHEIIKYNV